MSTDVITPNVLNASDIDRTEYLGGSDIAAVMGVSPWRSPVQLWLEKTGQTVFEISVEQQRRFDRGHKLEPYIIEMGIDELVAQGHDVELLSVNDRHYDEEHPFLTCEIDATLRVDGEIVNADAKSVHPFAAGKWGEQLTDEMPIEYAAQFMHGLGITKRRRCIVFALIGMDDMGLYYLDHDEETIASMRKHCVDFWQDNVIGGARPDYLKFEDIALLFPEDNGGTIQATDEIAQLVMQLNDTKQSIKDLKDRQEGLQISIGEFMEPHATLMQGTQKLLTWKAQQTSRIDTKALRLAEPSLADDYTRTTTSRVMRPVKQK